jgi:anti-sigma regulatory factor (Ser/Thr protein kinase)
MVIAQQAARMPADPGPVTVSHLDLVTLPSSPFWARRHIETTLKLWNAEHLIETANLLASELVTNAVAFSAGGSTGPGLAGVKKISLALELLGGELIIEVGDSDPGPPVLNGAGDGDAEGGRGLVLVEALSKDWGYELLPSGGKVVYCVIEA